MQIQKTLSGNKRPKEVHVGQGQKVINYLNNLQLKCNLFKVFGIGSWTQHPQFSGKLLKVNFSMMGMCNHLPIDW